MWEKTGIIEYNSFKNLQKFEQENLDYQIRTWYREPEITVMAIHGGNIEIGTGEIAENLGEKLDASTYIFEALKPKDNRKLHIRSSMFDEPQAVSMAKRAKTIISIHGYNDLKKEKIFIGGRNDVYKRIIKEFLEKEGFYVEEALKNLKGANTNNIVNQNKTGEGVQLELSTKLRKSFFINYEFANNDGRQKTEKFYKFIEVIAKATLEYKVLSAL
jgi:phage replication-related protein YjqB (UPF0714/DUF867 family)